MECSLIKIPLLGLQRQNSNKSLQDFTGGQPIHPKVAIHSLPLRGGVHVAVHYAVLIRVYSSVVGVGNISMDVCVV